MAMVTLGVGSRTWSPPIVDECSPPRPSPMDATWARGVVGDARRRSHHHDLAPGQCIGLWRRRLDSSARPLTDRAAACQVGRPTCGSRWYRLDSLVGVGEVAAPRPGRRPERVVRAEELEPLLGTASIDLATHGHRRRRRADPRDSHAPLRRLIERHPDRIAVIVISGEALDQPAICDTVVTLANDGTQWCSSTTDRQAALHVASATEPTAARSPAGWPASPTRGSTTGTRCCRQTCHSPSSSRRPRGRRSPPAGARPAPTRGPCAVIGRASDGVVEVDLVRDGPHALIAGTTGSGKSELLRTLVASLAAAVAARTTVASCSSTTRAARRSTPAPTCPTSSASSPTSTTTSPTRALRSLDAELRRRERLPARARRRRPRRRIGADAADEALPRLVVVIDEFAALAAELPGFLHALVGDRPARPQPRRPPGAGDAAPGGRGQRRHPGQHQPPHRAAPARHRRFGGRDRRRVGDHAPAHRAGTRRAAAGPDEHVTFQAARVP